MTESLDRMSGIERTDVVIVGAGPVGLFAVFQLGMMGLRAHVVDSLAEIGGQCQALYPEKPIYDIPGYPEISGAGLIERLHTQAAPFKPRFHLNQRVEAVQTYHGGWLIETGAGKRIACSDLLIAAGVGAFGPNRPPLNDLPIYEQQAPGEGVHYMVGRREAFQGKRIAIAGGGDSALDWTLALADIAEHIHVVHRRDKFRGHPDTVARVRELAARPDSNVELVVPYQLHALHGEAGRLTGVSAATMDGEVRHLSVDALLPFFGLSTKLGPIADWGVALANKRVSVDPTTLATSVPGIHAIGDIATYPGKLKLIMCGFSEAALAAHDIYQRVYPDTPLHWEYSTNTGVAGF